MTRARDRRVTAAAGTGDDLLEHPLAAARDRVAIRERREEGLLPASEHLPGPPVREGGRVVGARRHEERELTRARLVALVRERRVVGGHDGGLEGGLAGSPHDSSHGQLGRLLREATPGVERLAERLVSRGEPGVRGDDPGEAPLVLGRDTEPHETAPVLADERHGAEVELLHPPRDPVDVALVGVVGAEGGLVRAPEAHEIRSEDAVTRGDEDRDHLPVEEAPGRLAVEEEHRRRGGRALVEVVDAEAIHGRVARCERELGKVREPLVRRAQELHRVHDATRASHGTRSTLPKFPRAWMCACASLARANGKVLSTTGSRTPSFTRARISSSMDPSFGASSQR